MAPRYLALPMREVTAAARAMQAVLPVGWLEFSVLATREPRLLCGPAPPALARRVLAIAEVVKLPAIFVGRIVAAAPSLAEASATTLAERYSKLLAAAERCPSWHVQLHTASASQLARMLVSCCCRLAHCVAILRACSAVFDLF